MAKLLIWCFVWIQVHSSKKSSSWKHFWSNGDRGKKVVVTSRRSNVATSSHRDVPASRRWVNNAEVNKWKRRDVPTSRRRIEICTSSFKVRMAQKGGGHQKAYEQGTEFYSRVTQTSRKCPRFVLFLSFGYWNDVFKTKHFYLLIQYVLDLFLGLY